jgi:K319L-like, PKD domain
MVTFMIIILLSLSGSHGRAMAADQTNPVAIIEGTLLVYVDHEAYLDATESYDPAGNALTYQWTLLYSPRDSETVLTDPFSAHCTFSPDKTGVYQVQLVVNNGFVNSDPAYATITVIHRPYMW